MECTDIQEPDALIHIHDQLALIVVELIRIRHALEQGRSNRHITGVFVLQKEQLTAQLIEMIFQLEKKIAGLYTRVLPVGTKGGNDA